MKFKIFNMSIKESDQIHKQTLQKKILRYSIQGFFKTEKKSSFEKQRKTHKTNQTLGCTFFFLFSIQFKLSLKQNIHRTAINHSAIPSNLAGAARLKITHFNHSFNKGIKESILIQTKLTHIVSSFRKSKQSFI